MGISKVLYTATIGGISLAVRIVDVKIKTNHNWQNVKDVADWNTVKNTNTNWQQPLQTTLIGEQIVIEVEVIENNWSLIKDTFGSWQDIKTRFTDWIELKNY